MTDVTSQLEANGLPTQFESSSNQPEISHSIANTAATISNAEVSQVKQNAPDLDVATISKPVQPPAGEPERPVESAPTENDVSLAPGSDARAAQDEVQVNGHSTVPTEAVNSKPADTSFVAAEPTESGPSSISLQTTNATTSVLPESTAPSVSLPEQAPISDLRTSPHSDNLPPASIAKIEAEKHEMDNKADQIEVPAASSELPAVPLAQSIPETAAAPVTAPPPPAQQPEPDKPLTDPPNGTVVPSIESAIIDGSAETPLEPAPTPALPVTEDQEMTDAPPAVTAPASKPVHDRDEEMIDEPAPKRVKTDDHDEDRPLAEQVISSATSSVPIKADPGSAAPVDADDEVTTLRLQHMKKVISNLKKSNASQPFRIPVDYVALNIPSYPQIITHPMDLGTIDMHLKENKYKSVQAFKHDFQLIVDNCVRFNGPDHGVTQQGKKMEASFNNQMANLPPASLQEPSKADKKAMKPKLEPVRAPPPRRQSVTAKAASPKAPSPATFAPDPNGMPLIRRDSALDGRPKRAIVPPKRNSDFGGARPKKKKYELELRFCDEVLKIIGSAKHWQVNQYFTHPVDPVALNIPTYFQIIKKPMDLATVRQKLDSGMYEKAKDFEEDVRLIFKNCFKFNQEGDYVYQRGQEMEKLFSQEWAKKQDWISAREPDSDPASVQGDEEDEESEEDAESEDEDQDQLTKLQAQLEAIQSQMGQLKSKKKSPGVKSKKDKKKTKNQQPASKFPGLQAKDKTKKPAKKSSKAEKERYVTFAEKQYISNGIAMLPERPMQEALKIIQNSVPALANSESGEIELDIEEVPNHALLKLLQFVKKYAGPPPEEPKEQEYSTPAATKKKNKSMSKHEQEAHIAELKGQLHSYEKTSSPDALQSVETGAEDSDDDDSNEESEEE